MTRLGGTPVIDLMPLAVMRDTAVCDVHPEHELTIVTDGISAYAQSPDEMVEQIAFSRDDVTITAACPRPHVRYDDTCDGRLGWRLDTPSAWTADPAALEMMRYAEKIDR
jgi:hypothetical protein